jgi:hypothetical protein
MAFLRRGPSVTKLIEEANAAFRRFDADQPSIDDDFADVLSRVYAAVKISDFTVDQLDAIAAPLHTMPPLAAALCAAQVLHSVGRLLTADGVLGEPLAWLIATAGVGAAWKAAPAVEREMDCRNLITALDTLWRYEPSPFREVDHAQAVYLSGHLALRLGYDRDALASRWREALRLLAEVHPDTAKKTADRDRVARTKQSLESSWREQLAALSGAG